MELRPYQREAVDATFSYWRSGGGSPLIELGTGLGKSLVAATLCKELLTDWPGLRIGCVTHSRELILQNAQEMLRLWPGAPIGIHSAGLGRKDMRSKILFCGIQSVHRKADALGNFDVLIVDEAHLIPRNADTMYGKFIAACRARMPDMRLVLLTATPFRTDSGRLDQGQGAMADKIIYEYGLGKGVRDGYLVPLVSKSGEVKNDISSVHIRGGEFAANELQEAAMGNVRPAVAEIVDWGRAEDRKGWLIFAAGVQHAHEIRNEVRRHGVSCEVISGDMDNGDRDRIIAAYKAKQITALASVNCILTGFNVPHVDLLAWMRDTLSTGLWVQGNGRGTRVVIDLRGLKTAEARRTAIAESLKADCRVLDFTGNSRRLGPVDAVSIADKDRGDTGKVKPDEVRGKECPDCETLVAIQTRTCPQCAYAWPVAIEPKHEAKAESQAVVMATNAPPKWLAVLDVEFHHHPAKPDKPPTMRVDYRCGPVIRSEWICCEHSGFARQKAEDWWKRMGGNLPVPTTVKEALSRSDELDWPREICVRPDGKFFRIVGRKMPAKEEAA